MSSNLNIEHETPEEVVAATSLGHLRLRHIETNEIILVPTPSKDPNDPLNWSKGYRIYLAILTCVGMFMCNFLAAGVTVAIVAITFDFEGVTPMDPGFTAGISKVAYFFTTTALLQGTGNIIWMPLILKYGRRPMYILCFAGYLATIFWAGFAKSYGSELAARIILGLFAGLGECVAPLTISDLFFVHERGLYMAMYTAALSAGVSGGIIISGLITISHTWRYIYFVAAAIVGALVILVFFTFPETAFNRGPVDQRSYEISHPDRKSSIDKGTLEKGIACDNIEYGSNSLAANESDSTVNREDTAIPPKMTYVQSLALVHGRYVDETYWKMFYRPIVLLALPPILWATLVMSVTIGFLVAISSNFASAFSTTYGFAAYQSGLCFISGFIGTMLGIFFGGSLSDTIADILTRRNGGIREPEMRLPALTIALICTPLGLVLFGVGIDKELHWMVPTLGLGFLSFAIAQGTNVSLVYIIDSYRPIAGETIVTQLAFKSCFGFLLSFYTNPWIAEAGYSDAFGAMAGISGAVLILWIPFFIWGKKIREATLKWHIMTHLIGWSEDREVGE